MDEATRKHFPGAAKPRGGLYSAPVPKAGPVAPKTPSRLNRILMLSKLKGYLESNRESWRGCNVKQEIIDSHVKEIGEYLGLLEELKTEFVSRKDAEAPRTEGAV